MVLCDGGSGYAVHSLLHFPRVLARSLYGQDGVGRREAVEWAAHVEPLFVQHLDVSCRRHAVLRVGDDVVCALAGLRNAHELPPSATIAICDNFSIINYF